MSSVSTYRIDVRAPLAALLLALVASAAFAQLSNSGSQFRTHDGSQDPADAAVRHQKSTMGLTVEDWARRLDDPEPEQRLAAVKLLADSTDPKATEALMRAVADADVRVATAAIDALGRRGTKGASEVLSERLVLSGAPPDMRSHILVALGRIRDPGSAKNVLAFAEAESQPELRSMAIRLVGELGDASALDDLQRMSAAETDPRTSTLLQDAIAQIRSRESSPHTK